jgi:hypothetical protein
MRHALRRILEGILAEVERFAGALEVLERAFLHGLPDLAIGDKVPLVHVQLSVYKAATALSCGVKGTILQPTARIGPIWQRPGLGRFGLIAPCGGSKGGITMLFPNARLAIVRFAIPVLLCAAPLFAVWAGSPEQKDAEPKYDASSNIDVMVVVADVKDVPVGSPLNGTHLMVRPESSKSNAETTDVYLAPDDYLKDFGCHFAKGDRIQVKGSKVRFNGGPAVLAREVRLEATTVYLRDEHGEPYWKF